MPIRRTHKVDRSADVTELVASARVDITVPSDMAYLRSTVGWSKTKSRKPWQWYEGIGEVHYALSRGARIAGYTSLIPRKLDKLGRPGREIKRGEEAAIVRRLESPYGGVRALAERYFTLMKVPAESYLIRVREDDEVVGWDFVSADELDVASLDAARDADGALREGTVLKRITMPKSSGIEAMEQEIEARDFLGRIWRPSSRYVDMTDSSLLANETNCDLLDLLTKSLRAKLMNRLMSNGIWYIPSEINDVKTARTNTGTGELSDNKVIDRLLRSAVYQATNPGQPEAALPAFVSGPAQFAEALRHITPELEIYEVEMKLRQELIDRILMGLDVQPQDVRGLGDSSHWSAWAVSDDERRINVQPEIETMCWALTNMVLRHEMRERGLPDGRIAEAMLWYDLTAANVKTNLAEDARQAHDRGFIGDSGARLLTGVDEAFAPTDDEVIRWVGRQVRDPYLATFGLTMAKDIDWSMVGKGKSNGPTADSPADDPESGPGSDSGSPNKNDSDTPRRLRPA